MKNHIFLIAISIALFSCNKVKNQYTSVNGVVKLGLNDSLMANVPIDLWESYGSAFNNGSKVIASTTSDENGNFSFSSFITKPNQDYYVHVNDDAYLVMSDSKNNDIIN